MKNHKFIWARFGLAVFFIITGAVTFTDHLHTIQQGAGNGWDWFWVGIGVFVMAAWSSNARSAWIELENK